MPTEVLVKILGSLPDLQTVGSSNLTCRHIHDVCAENTKAITDALISSVECSELAVQYYGIPLQFAGRSVNAHLINSPPGFPFQRWRIQRARKILAVAEIGHRAQRVYLTKWDRPAAIDAEIWQSIFYQTLMLSLNIQRQELDMGRYAVKVEPFRDLDILTLSQISDMYATLGQLCGRQTDGPRDAGWPEDDELLSYDWEHSWFLIYCIRSYLCEHSWYRDWNCGIGEGNFMTRREPYGKLVKDLVDEKDCVMDIRRNAYAHIIMGPMDSQLEALDDTGCLHDTLDRGHRVV